MLPHKDCRPKKVQTYGEFFGIDQLLIYFNIKNTQTIKKLLNLNVNCAHLKSYFKQDELKEIEPLISLLLSKDEAQISNLIRNAAAQEPLKDTKLSNPNKARYTDKKFDCKIKQIKPALKTNLLKKSELNSIGEKDLKRLIMYVDNY
ncbi:hypothetical protein BpHYR1_039205 [Brachionus plicatilis]|uniref:Uncharacterized protein n=1 Tax=Brachionus plicatilis TaxID=10195 RepID=A0A3M7QW47_BRAPC|nr:hypothetical protein BpHYR1_039205 [Brachionus plicatilis]